MTDYASSAINSTNPTTTSNSSNSNNNNNITKASINANCSNVNFLMRKERSLDRSSATDNFLENLGFVSSHSSAHNTSRRSHTLNSNNNNNNNNISQPSTPQHVPSYANSTLYLNSNSSQMLTPTITASSRQTRNQHHHRSNSILNGANPLTMLNSLNFTRDYGGLRSSARALSTNSFSVSNLQRDTSGNSIKSMLNSASNAANDLYSTHQQQQQQHSQQTSPTHQQSKLNFIKDLQIRLMDTQKECYYLRCELDTSQQKLTSSMQSIKQFWSPELKRERLHRKEETAKYAMLLEQYKLLQSQYQTLLDTYEQQSIQMQQAQMQMQQHDEMNAGSSSSASRQFAKEKSLLKKTISELEMRINAQKQSLSTKDETIKKLFHMVKSIGNKNNDIGSFNNKIDVVRIVAFFLILSDLVFGLHTMSSNSLWT